MAGPKPNPRPGVGSQPGRLPRGWHPDVWRLRVALLYAADAVGRASNAGRLLDGAERWVKLGGGAGKLPGTAWWAAAVLLVRTCASVCQDDRVTVCLSPWLVGGRPAPVPPVSVGTFHAVTPLDSGGGGR